MRLLRRVAHWPAVVQVRLVEEEAHARAVTALPAASIEEIAWPRLSVAAKAACRFRLALGSGLALVHQPHNLLPRVGRAGGDR